MAEDLTQDTFTSAWMNIDRYKGRASLKTLLHRIAYNKFLDSERGKRKRSEFISGWKESNSNVQTTSDPLYKITEDEHSYLLLKAMYKLESADYIVIILHYIQDFSYREMANVLNEPVGTIKWRTSQALKRLRDLLTDRI